MTMTLLNRIIFWIFVRYIDGVIWLRNRDLPRSERREISKCIVKAMQHFREHGGYVIMKRSTSDARLPQFAWSEKLPEIETRSFSPTHRVLGSGALRACPWFKGEWGAERIGG